MKTNIILESQSRNLFGQIVRQQTKEGMLNLSDLQEAYTIARVKNGWVEKNISRIMENDKETLFYLLEKQGIINIPMCSFIESINNQGFAKYMKTLGVYKTTGARNTKTVWVNPYIWVMVAMELNPIFKAEVIGWLTDSLIINRIEAGNFYKELSRAMSKFKDVNYVQVAKALNYCIFGKHETGLRNLATKEELKELERLESRLAFAIDMDYIKTFDELIIELQKVYKLNN
jgi:hypothetical protein